MSSVGSSAVADKRIDKNQKGLLSLSVNYDHGAAAEESSPVTERRGERTTLCVLADIITLVREAEYRHSK